MSTKRSTTHWKVFQLSDSLYWCTYSGWVRTTGSARCICPGWHVQPTPHFTSTHRLLKAPQRTFCIILKDILKKNYGAWCKMLEPRSGHIYETWSWLQSAFNFTKALIHQYPIWNWIKETFAFWHFFFRAAEARNRLRIMRLRYQSSRVSTLSFRYRRKRCAEKLFNIIILGMWSLKTSWNKNWVTVRDKCPQIDVQFKWHTFFF